MSEYPNYSQPMQPYPPPYPGQYPSIPPVAAYQPQYPAALQPQQIPPTNSQVIPPPHPPKKNHVPSDQRMKIHTIFMFNLAFGLTHDQLLRFCKQYGDVSQLIYPLVKQGMAFCTYYDLRSAERAVKEMYGQKLNGRAVKTNFAYKPPPHSRRDPKELCSTILVKSSKGEESSITFDEIKDVMSAFGELRDAEEVFEDSQKEKVQSGDSNQENKESEEPNNDEQSKIPIQGQWIVKYYDLRDAQKCVETGMVKYRDEELNLEFILDDDMGDEVTDPPPPPPPKRARQFMHEQHQHDRYDHYEPQSQTISPPPITQPPPSQVPYGYPPQPYPYMSYPYAQVPYGYPPQSYTPIQPIAYPQQTPAQPIPPAIQPPPLQPEIPSQIPTQVPSQLQSQIPGQVPAQISSQISAQIPGQIQSQIVPSTAQYPRSDQFLQPTQQSQIPYPTAPQQPIQGTSLPPLPPLPPPSQPQQILTSQPKPQSPAQTLTSIPQHSVVSSQQSQPAKQSRSLLSVIGLNDDNSNQEEKMPEEMTPPAQQKSMPSALSSLMGLESDDEAKDFPNDFDSFDSDSNKKNNNSSSNGLKDSLSYLE